MTPKQTSLYWREWGKVRARLISDGLTSEQAAAKRHALHAKALGRDKSHLAFTNQDFDKILAAFRAVYDDSNLDAQLRQIDQPEERRHALVNKCWEACRVFIKGNDPAHRDDLCQRYMDGTAKKVFGKYERELTEHQLAALHGILDKHANRELAKQRQEHADKVAAEERRARETDLPF